MTAPAFCCVTACLVALAIGAPTPVAATAASPAAKPAAATKRPGKPPASRRPAAPAVPQATPEQAAAAEKVFYGRYECEMDQAIDIAASSRHASYVDVRHGKAVYLMKPVLSSTGAVRLEDVKGRTLMVQIATKSMLMDVKAGRRLVDECVSPKQREAIEAARLQAALPAGAASAPDAPVPAASAPVPAASAPAPAASVPAPAASAPAVPEPVADAASAPAAAPSASGPAAADASAGAASAPQR